MSLRKTADALLTLSAPTPKRIWNLGGSSAALFLSSITHGFIAIEQDDDRAERLAADMTFYRQSIANQTPLPQIVHISSLEGPEHAGPRAEALYRILVQKEPCALVLSHDALMLKAWDDVDLALGSLRLSQGDVFDRTKVETTLHELGYRRAPLVTERGHYSLRGFILDIFASTAQQPVRVEFFGDEIESIRAFETDTQRSNLELEEVLLLPSGDPSEGTLLDSLLAGMPRYRLAVMDTPLRDNECVLMRYAIEGEGLRAEALPMTELGVLPEERKDIYALGPALERLKGSMQVLIVGSSMGQSQRLKELLAEYDIIAPIIKPSEVSDYEGWIGMTVGDLSQGLHMPGMLVLTENELFGGRPAYRSLKKSRVSKLITTLEDLDAGDYIVHVDRGIGKFKSLIRQHVEGIEYDLLAIEYAGESLLYLPLHAIHKIRKYRAEEGTAPKLDDLGGKGWQKIRERVRARIEEMASKLIRLYAEREVSEATALSHDGHIHNEFDSFFPYEETPDQTRSIAEIKADLESDRPMDRLLCGDVGYGKTEVAMRAAFKAVHDGFQVAVLVPTTLLCEQHMRVFKKRFEAFPVNIEALDRFRTAKEKKDILKRLSDGNINIVIATHSLLRQDLVFRSLGLLIVDEEHRFGVKQKERIKELKKGVHVLAMSATPIPRTLQMSLTGIRRMSVIETPPEERLAVSVTVSVYDEALVRKAIEHELNRGGQVFFVHNRIKDIDKVARRLQQSIPLARMEVAHGQMAEHELEDVMMKFLQGKADVLLSTSIIGAGLDIPTANTIIINMADRMGLADLYQLKGRVGRSSVHAFAYFLVQDEALITEDARKRLQAIQDLSSMGAGLRLAMKDLEIRGAGNLLGQEQAGSIQAVGLDLYIEMLETAVSELRGLKKPEAIRAAVNLRLNAYIPEDCIEDMALRLSAYRSIASTQSMEGLTNITAEMTDRFGRLPEPFMNLLAVRAIGLRAEALGISELTRLGSALRFIFQDKPAFDIDGVVTAFKGKVKFLPNGMDVYVKGANSLEESSKVLDVLEALPRVSIDS